MLPPVPKPLRSVDAPTKEELARRVDEWARRMQALAAALREGVPDVLSRLDALEAGTTGGGGGSVTFGSPVALTAGGTNADGVSTDAARADHVHATAVAAPAALVVGGSAVTGASGDFADADHVHALADFGTGAGEFTEGNDSRLSDDRTASGLRTASTVVSVSGATAPTAGQVLTATGGSAATWQTPSAGGSTVSIWEPRAEPASAHADDNEFLSSIADFTAWDHGAYQTRTLVTADKCLEISGTGNTALRVGGMYKAVPSGGEFSVVMFCAMSASVATHAAVGLAVFQDATNATGDLRNVRLGNASLAAGPTIFNDTLSAYNGSSSALTTYTGGGASAWFRIRCNGTTCSTDYSIDGTTWLTLSSVTLGFTPAHMGPIFHVLPATAAKAYFYCFRVKSGAGSSDFDANRPGRLVTVGV